MGCNFVWNHTYDMGPKLHDEVQLPLYYSRCKIAEFCQYQYYNDQLAGLLKSGNKKAFKSYFGFETEWYPIEHKWCDLKQQWCDLKSVKMIVFTRPPSMFYKYWRKNIMTECIQAYVSSSDKQPFTNCFFFPWFTGALRCVWVRLVYIILDYDYKLYSRRHCSPYTVYLDVSGDYPLS